MNGVETGFAVAGGIDEVLVVHEGVAIGGTEEADRGFMDLVGRENVAYEVDSVARERRSVRL
jgi:hypothetical protein